MNKNHILLTIGIIMVLFGLLKPNISNINIFNPPNQSINDIVVEKPLVKETLDACNNVSKILSSGPNPRTDALNLASLFSDISKLVELDGSDEVIKNTADLSSVNSIAGSLLKLNVKGKYDGLSDACQNVIVSVIGDDNLPLDKELRSKTVIAFRNLAWACQEGAK